MLVHGGRNQLEWMKWGNLIQFPHPHVYTMNRIDEQEEAIEDEPENMTEELQTQKHTHTHTYGIHVKNNRLFFLPT